MEKNNFGDYLRKLRKDKRLTLVELSELSGVSNPYLSQIENNKFTPSPEILKKVSDPLDINYFTLLQKAGYIKHNPYADNSLLQTITTNFVKYTETLPQEVAKEKLDLFEDGLQKFFKKGNDESFSMTFKKFEEYLQEKVIDDQSMYIELLRPLVDLHSILNENRRVYFKGIPLREKEVKIIEDIIEVLVIKNRF